MAEKKKKPSAEFGKEKNAFAGGSPKKGNDSQKTKQKQPGTHQPRDADVTSGHDVQKLKKSVQPETSGHNVQKPERDSFSGSQNNFGKTPGQKAKPGQKKRRQAGQFRKENNFTESKEKPDSGSNGKKTQDNLFKEQNNLKNHAGKTPGQKTKPGQKKRRKPGEFQRENSFTSDKRKPGNSADNQMQSSFSQEQNHFHSDTGKTPEKKAKPGQKKRRQAGQFQKKIILQNIKKKPTAAIRAAKRRIIFLKNRTPLRRMTGRNRAGVQGIPEMITAAVILTTGAKKRENTTGGGIRTGSARKNLILNVTSRRRTPLLQKMIPLPMA